MQINFQSCKNELTVIHQFRF